MCWPRGRPERAGIAPREQALDDDRSFRGGPNHHPTTQSTTKRVLNKVLPGIRENPAAEPQERSTAGSKQTGLLAERYEKSVRHDKREEAFRRFRAQTPANSHILFQENAAFGPKEGSSDSAGTTEPANADAQSGYYTASEYAGSLVPSSVASSLVPPRAPAGDPAIRTYFQSGSLPASATISPGFYACFGDFPEAAESQPNGGPPTLQALRKCTIQSGREAIVFDVTMDQPLRTFLDSQVINAILEAGTEELHTRVTRVVAIVCARLGMSRGARSDSRPHGAAKSDAKLSAAYPAHALALQQAQVSVILPVGSLKLGTSRHRALLAKLALKWVGIDASIDPDGAGGSRLMFKEGKHGYLVNITDHPGTISLLSSDPSVHSSTAGAPLKKAIRSSGSSARRTAVEKGLKKVGFKEKSGKLDASSATPLMTAAVPAAGDSEMAGTTGISGGV